jgi:hypothetical protein
MSGVQEDSETMKRRAHEFCHVNLLVINEAYEGRRDVGSKTENR